MSDLRKALEAALRLPMVRGEVMAGAAGHAADLIFADEAFAAALEGTTDDRGAEGSIVSDRPVSLGALTADLLRMTDAVLGSIDYDEDSGTSLCRYCQSVYATEGHAFDCVTVLAKRYRAALATPAPTEDIVGDMFDLDMREDLATPPAPTKTRPDPVREWEDAQPKLTPAPTEDPLETAVNKAMGLMHPAPTEDATLAMSRALCMEDYGTTTAAEEPWMLAKAARILARIPAPTEDATLDVPDAALVGWIVGQMMAAGARDASDAQVRARRILARIPAPITEKVQLNNGTWVASNEPDKMTIKHEGGTDGST